MTASGEKTHGGLGRVRFLARKDAIQTKIEAGYTLLSIYEEQAADLGISYSQFGRYVNQFIRSKTRGAGNEQSKPTRVQQPSGTAAPAAATEFGDRGSNAKPRSGSRTDEGAGQPKFKFNPKAGSKDDLI